MPKLTKHPRLRAHIKRGKAGQVWTSYWYDMRGTGKPDVSLGTDYAEALRRWDELHNLKPRQAGTLEEALARWESECLPTYASATTRRNYALNLKRLRPVFGSATWESISLPHLHEYLQRRTAKTQANREMSLLSIIWGKARLWGMTETPFPAARMGRWKNAEHARDVRVSDTVFDAIYRHADQVLRDAMDLATATGLRVRDVLGVRVTDFRGDLLVVRASKTGKRAEFDMAASDVLPRLIARRRESKALHVWLLTTEHGRHVTERMLTARFEAARAAASVDVPEAAEAWLRDMRKRAAQLAGGLHEASQLLQHSSQGTTSKHYGAGAKVRPVR
jgi:hypothetical protein